MATYSISIPNIDDEELQAALADTGLTAEAFIVEALQSELATRRLRRLCPKEVIGDTFLDTLTKAVQKVEEGTDDLNAPINSTLNTRIHQAVQQRVLNQESR